MLPASRLSLALFWFRMSEPWVKVDEVTSPLGVAKDTVYRWVQATNWTQFLKLMLVASSTWRSADSWPLTSKVPV